MALVRYSLTHSAQAPKDRPFTSRILDVAPITFELAIRLGTGTSFVI